MTEPQESCTSSAGRKVSRRMASTRIDGMEVVVGCDVAFLDAKGERTRCDGSSTGSLVSARANWVNLGCGDAFLKLSRDIIAEY